jgi:hypothetical protein
MITLNYFFMRTCLGIGCLVLNALAAPLQAQEKPAPDYAPKLAQAVRLTLGKTTLAEALEALSKQTGIQIDAAEYLKDRVVIVQMDGITGRTALNALTALNDLKWSAIGPNHLVVDRPASGRPESITQVPDLIAKALPKDIRDCLLVGIPHNKGWEFAEVDAFKRKSDFEYPQFVSSRTGDLVQEQQKLFLASLPAVLTPGTKIPFKTLTPTQQSELLSILFFREISRLSFSLMHDNLAPYQKDVMQVSLHLHPSDNILEIGTVMHEGNTDIYRFFGAPIAPPPSNEQDKVGKKP